MSASGGGTCEPGDPVISVMQFRSARKRLVGQTVRYVEYADADEGIKLEFLDGTILEVGFAGLYGNVLLDGVAVDTNAG